MKRIVVMALAAAGLMSLQTAANAEDTFLAQFVGSWIGRGVMKQSAEAEPERVYCKISNTLSADGESLVQKGRCSLASNSGPLNGTITAVGGNAYSGELSSLASRGPASLSGTLRGSHLVLTSKFTDKLSGDPVEATNTLTIVAGGYKLTATRPDPKTGSTFTSSEIVFTAR